MSKAAEYKTFLESKVHKIFEGLLIDILMEKPSDIIDFMRSWLDSNGDKFREGGGDGHGNKDHLPDSEESGDELPIEEIPKKLANPAKMKQRASVSAEVYGNFNKKSNFKARFIPKSQGQKNKIIERLSQAFMFSGIDQKEQDIVVGAMEEKKFKKDDWVIKQGEDGDTLYLVDSGKLDCFKRFPGNTSDTFLKTYEAGEGFGELALLYNAPRAASIKAKEDSVLFALDRETFNHIVKDAASRKRDKYENFLSKVELLQGMDPYERSQIADALVTEKFKAGSYVVNQGEEGNKFYFVEEGELVALKAMSHGEPPKQVFSYKENDYFGELALLKEQPRQASILAKSDCSLVSLDRAAFKRMLGPLENILSRNTNRYD